jgi:hypothetical protein
VQLFNLGKGSPDYVNELIEILEKNLRRKAKRYDSHCPMVGSSLELHDDSIVLSHIDFEPIRRLHATSL